MIRNIVKDAMFLAAPSQEATAADATVAKDLEDTLRANAEACVGLAANMIGVRKRIITVSVVFSMLTMYNPVIISKSEPYDTQEGCLSLPGTRRTRRYGKITVEYRDRSFKKCMGEFSGYTAQIIQHEIDHLNGILI